MNKVVCVVLLAVIAVSGCAKKIESTAKEGELAKEIKEESNEESKEESLQIYGWLFDPLTTLTTGQVEADSIKGDLAHGKLFGNIKSIEHIKWCKNYDCDGSGTEGKEIDFYFFDEKGRITKSIQSRYEFDYLYNSGEKYPSKMTLKPWDHTEDRPSGYVTEITYERDSAGNVIVLNGKKWGEKAGSFYNFRRGNSVMYYEGDRLIRSTLKSDTPGLGYDLGFTYGEKDAVFNQDIVMINHSDSSESERTVEFTELGMPKSRTIKWWESNTSGERNYVYTYPDFDGAGNWSTQKRCENKDSGEECLYSVRHIEYYE